MIDDLVLKQKELEDRLSQLEEQKLNVTNLIKPIEKDIFEIKEEILIAHYKILTRQYELDKLEQEKEQQRIEDRQF
jgi:hypothetical protein